ncbi:protoporphyrinogen oxidase [Kocuria sp. HSID16901]|uniref:protoporphyrinogen oxidase n=1 Tax=Kocuria sp. HSID16901 TaxID=2419505 RepID=UPI000AC80B48|nr:protoporphyrinogen oxidase [Kocuria sp. HSID16901]MCT1367512.1 protoporphyrinogen oxidase [Rothia sp. p3-SID1597]
MASSPDNSTQAGARTMNHGPRASMSGSSPEPEPKVHQPLRTARTALVVGGGVSGLLAARELAERGLRVVVTEARDHFGGAVGAHQVAGIVLDSGAESYATRNGSVENLISDLGLTDLRTTPDEYGSWLYLPNGPTRMPSSGILGIPANPQDPELRGTLTTMGRRRASMDRHLPPTVGTHQRTLGGLVRARMGQQIVDRLVAPVTMGIHSTHPDELDVDTVAPGLREGIKTYGSLGASAAVLRSNAPAGTQVGSLVGGMNQLSEALVQDLTKRGVRLFAGCDVIAIDRDEVTQSWIAIRRQEGSAGKRAGLTADVLVLATDGPTAVRLLGPHLDSDLLPDVRRGPEIALVTLVVDAPVLNTPPRGTGVLVSDQVRNVRAKALTHASAKWRWIAERVGENRHVLRLSYGRGHTSEGQSITELTLSDEQLMSLALHDASRIMGTSLGRKHLIDADVVRWKSAMPKVSIGHKEKVTSFRKSLSTLNRVAAVGAWLSGTGLASLVPDTRAAIEELDLEPGDVETSGHHR